MELKWEYEQGQHNIKVSNNTKVRFAVKVRCTDTDMYRYVSHAVSRT